MPNLVHMCYLPQGNRRMWRNPHNPLCSMVRLVLRQHRVGAFARETIRCPYVSWSSSLEWSVDASHLIYFSKAVYFLYLMIKVNLVSKSLFATTLYAFGTMVCCLCSWSTCQLHSRLSPCTEVFVWNKVLTVYRNLYFGGAWSIYKEKIRNYFIIKCS